MSDDLLWQVFTDTGDPMCWLMHRAEVKSKDKGKAAEDKPQSLG